MLDNGWNDQVQASTAAYGAAHLDAASLHIGLSGLLDPADDRFQATVTAVEAGLRSGSATRLPAELAELNTVRAAHGDQQLLAALDRAVAFCRWRAAEVRSILAAGAGVPEPKIAAGEALTLDLPAVPVRALADYAIGAP